jgi:hypothetical protein
VVVHLQFSTLVGQPDLVKQVVQLDSQALVELPSESPVDPETVTEGTRDRSIMLAAW